MPATSINYPLDDPQKVEKLCSDERAKRGKLLDLVWKYYRSEHKKPLKVEAGQPDDNVIINLCKTVVNRSVAMLVGGGVEFQIDGNRAVGLRTDTEKYLDRVWNGGLEQGGKKTILLTDLGISGHVTGSPVIRIAKPDDGSEYPRIISLDPKNVIPFWKSDDIDRVMWFSVYGDKFRQDIVRWTNEDGSTDWLIRDFTQKKSNSRYELQAEEFWGFPWPPILMWKNLPNPNQFYGESDLMDADVNDQLNFVITNVNRIIRFFAHPRTIGRGFSVGDIVHDRIGGILTVPAADEGGTETEVFNLEMQSDLASSMKLYEELKAAFIAQTGSVDLSAYRDKIGQMTNFGLSVIYKDAIDRLGVRRALYGSAIIEINRRILDMGGYGDQIETKLYWGDPLPANKKEQVDVVTLKRQMGAISLETATREVGEDYEHEQALLIKETASATQNPG